VTSPRLALALLVLARPASPLGDEARPAAPAASDAAAPAAPAASDVTTFVQLFGSIGYDFGFSESATVTFTDGSTQTMRSNGGVVLAVGANFPGLLGRVLDTRATVGLKYDAIAAKNGDIKYLAVPVELLELVDVRPFRFGAGFSLALWPRLRGTGFASGADTAFENSLGLELCAEYVWRPRTASDRALTVGPRYLWQKLRTKGDGIVAGANVVGIAVGLAL
jgi:hypothetical protein